MNSPWYIGHYILVRDASATNRLFFNRAYQRKRTECSSRRTKGFYAPRLTRGAAVLSERVVAQVEELLADGASEAEAADTLALKRDTLRKAVRAGRIRTPLNKKKSRRIPR